MNWTRAFLGLQVFVWLPAVAVLFMPGLLHQVAGLYATSPTGTTEIRAMYGGLEGGVGVMCFIALFRPDFVKAALFALACLTGGLAIGRALGWTLDGSGTFYTIGVLGFEVFTLVVSLLLLSRSRTRTTRGAA